jgi:hypothetical protein
VVDAVILVLFGVVVRRTMQEGPSTAPATPVEVTIDN